MNLFKRAAESSKPDGTIDYEALIKGTEGQEIGDIVSKLVNMTPEQINAEMTKMENKETSMFDAFYEYWIASILSGLSTHVTNIASNMLTAAIRVPTKFLEEKLFRTAKKGEFYAELSALFSGMKPALQAFHNYRKSDGATQEGGQKVEEYGKAIKGKKGEVIRTPLRYLGAADAFFKALNGHMTQASSAVAEAHNALEGKGITPDQTGYAQSLRAEVEYYLANPTDEMIKKRKADSEYYTFTKNIDNKAVNLVMAARNLEIPMTGIKPLKLFLPFVTHSRLTSQRIHTTTLLLSSGNSPCAG